MTNLSDGASLLRSEGHAGAGSYPLWRVHHELEAARHRINARTQSERTLDALAAAARRDRNAAKQFTEVIEGLTS